MHCKNDLNILSYFTYLHYHDDTVTRSFLLFCTLVILLLLYWWRNISLCCFSSVRVVTFHHLNSFFYACVVLRQCNEYNDDSFIRRSSLWRNGSWKWSTSRLIAPNVRQLQEGESFFLHPEDKWVSHAPRMADSFIAKKSWRALLDCFTWEYTWQIEPPLAEKSKERIHTASPIRYFYACTSSRHLLFLFLID